jgi:hypothetical protein
MVAGKPDRISFTAGPAFGASVRLYHYRYILAVLSVYENRILMPVKSFAPDGAFWFAVKPRIHPGEKQKAFRKEKCHRHDLKKL